MRAAMSSTFQESPSALAGSHFLSGGNNSQIAGRKCCYGCYASPSCREPGDSGPANQATSNEERATAHAKG